jgi:hypothetical protein
VPISPISLSIFWILYPVLSFIFFILYLQASARLCINLRLYKEAVERLTTDTPAPLPALSPASPPTSSQLIGYLLRYHTLSPSLSLSLSLSHSHSLSACVCIEYRLLASVPLPLDLYLLLLGTRSFLKCLSDSFSVLHIPILILIIGFFPPLEVMQTWFLLYFLVLDFTVLSMTTFGAASAPNPNPNKSFEVQIVIWGFCFNFLCFFFDSWA